MTEEHAKAASEKFNIPKIYTGKDSWEKMIDNEKLDIIIICTPNYLHAPMVLKAIENNCHILCEKPIAISQEELNRIDTKLNAKSLIFFTNFQSPCVNFRNRYVMEISYLLQMRIFQNSFWKIIFK